MCKNHAKLRIYFFKKIGKLRLRTYVSKNNGYLRRLPLQNKPKLHYYEHYHAWSLLRRALFSS